MKVAYLTELRRRVFEAVGMSLENASGSNASIHAAFLVANSLANLPHIVLFIVHVL